MVVLCCVFQEWLYLAYAFLRQMEVLETRLFLFVVLECCTVWKFHVEPFYYLRQRNLLWAELMHNVFLDHQNSFR